MIILMPLFVRACDWLHHSSVKSSSEQYEVLLKQNACHSVPDQRACQTFHWSIPAISTDWEGRMFGVLTEREDVLLCAFGSVHPKERASDDSSQARDHWCHFLDWRSVVVVQLSKASTCVLSC